MEGTGTGTLDLTKRKAQRQARATATVLGVSPWSPIAMIGGLFGSWLSGQDDL